MPHLFASKELSFTHYVYSMKVENVFSWGESGLSQGKANLVVARHPMFRIKQLAADIVMGAHCFTQLA